MEHSYCYVQGNRNVASRHSLRWWSTIFINATARGGPITTKYHKTEPSNVSSKDDFKSQLTLKLRSVTMVPHRKSQLLPTHKGSTPSPDLGALFEVRSADKYSDAFSLIYVSGTWKAYLNPRPLALLGYLRTCTLFEASSREGTGGDLNLSGAQRLTAEPR